MAMGTGERVETREYKLEGQNQRCFGVTDIERTLPRPKVRRQQHPDRRTELDLIAYNADILF